jgi:hypothetical protein
MRGTVYIHSFGIPPFFQAFLPQTNPYATMHGFEKDFPFCSNPDCELYVRAGDPGVMGSGNWAELPDGRIVGRSIYSGVYLCDVCGREWRPVRTFGIVVAM